MRAGPEVYALRSGAYAPRDRSLTPELQRGMPSAVTLYSPTKLIFSLTRVERNQNVTDPVSASEKYHGF
jgi:hypothetical protein